VLTSSLKTPFSKHDFPSNSHDETRSRERTIFGHIWSDVMAVDHDDGAQTPRAAMLLEEKLP
jgi:hypothetical protein